MANQPLNTYAPPYLQTPPNFYFYLPQPYNVILPSVLPYQLSTYYIHLQPSHRKSPPVFVPRSPSPAKKITFSLTPVPAGPRIPKPRLRRRFRQTEMKWVPKKKVDENEKVGFTGKRWKNSRNEYQKVLPLEADTTSLMIKNVPNKYTRKLLIEALDHHCEAENQKIDDGGVVSAYDFVYLPIDFNQRANAGFAFVNFTSPEAALRFRDAFNGKRWNLFDSSKVAEISKARIQGIEALVKNCEAMSFIYGSKEDMPVWFSQSRDGSGQVGSEMCTVGRF